MLILGVAVLVIAAVVISSVQNAVPVSVAFLTWKSGASLAVVVFLAFVLGVVVTALSGLALRVKGAGQRRTGKADPLKTGRNISSNSGAP